jgi:hypothetical protein
VETPVRIHDGAKVKQSARAVLAAGVMLVVLAIGAVFVTRETANGLTEEVGCGRACDLFQIAWVGDILLGDAADSRLSVHGHAWPFQYVRPLIQADFIIGNAEGPITNRQGRYFAGQRWHYNAAPESAVALAEVGFNALGLSNNHVLDRGPDGLADTLANLRGAGIRPFGAGMEIGEAAAPLLVETAHGTVAVLAFGERWRTGAAAGPGQFGTVPFTEEAVAHGATLARAAAARWSVAYLHWGENYSAVTSRQRAIARLFAQAGYDLVIGHHPHVAQEFDVVDGMPVDYSLGNFTFGAPGRFSAEFPGYGLIARTTFGPQGLDAIELSCIVTDNKLIDYQPRPCDGERAHSVMQGLGGRVSVQNDSEHVVGRIDKPKG